MIDRLAFGKDYAISLAVGVRRFFVDEKLQKLMQKLEVKHQKVSQASLSDNQRSNDKLNGAQFGRKQTERFA